MRKRKKDVLRHDLGLLYFLAIVHLMIDLTFVEYCSFRGSGITPGIFCFFYIEGMSCVVLGWDVYK